MKVVRAIKRRLRQGDIAKVIVASITGRPAFSLVKAVAPTSVICVTLDPESRHRYHNPTLLKEELLRQGVTVVDAIAEPLGRELTFRNW